MMSLHKFFMIAGIIQLGIGAVLEILYWAIWKNLVWILTIYPPSGLYNLIKVVPILGVMIILVGLGCLTTSIWLFLRADLEFLRKIY